MIPSGVAVYHFAGSSGIFYSEGDFARALDSFKQHITGMLSKLNEVRWSDENLILVIEQNS
jgi:hypothetical protein